MQKEALSNLSNRSRESQEQTNLCLDSPIQLADPFDLTKMLDISPGLYEMQGTAKILNEFYLKE